MKLNREKELKSMKRFLSVLISSILLLTLVACGGGGNSLKPGSSVEEVQKFCEEKGYSVQPTHEGYLFFNDIEALAGIDIEDETNKFILSYFEFESEEHVNTLKKDMENPSIEKATEDFYIYSEDDYIISYIAFSDKNIAIAYPYDDDNSNKETIVNLLADLGMNVK